MFTTAALHLLLLTSSIAGAVEAALPPAVAPIVTPEATPPAPIALTPTQIFSGAKDLVFKLETRLIGKTAGREHGTAFVVAANGLLATNFHVVADYVAKPERYEMVLHVPTGAINAKVLAIDPVNDVAIIKVEQNFPTELSVVLSQPPAIGDPLFSIGFPKSEEITLTQGNFNGQRVMGLANVMALSMPLNPGMSGGPCFDRFGHVVGINRALAVSAQNISYLSPNEALNLMVARAKSTPPPSNFTPQIVQAIQAQEQWALGNLTKVSEHQRVGHVSFTAPLSSLICGQDKTPGLAKAETEFIVCRTPTLALLGGEQVALNVIVAAVQSDSFLSRTNAFGVLKSSYQRSVQNWPSQTTRSTAGRAPQEKCNARQLRNHNHVQMTIRFCSIEVVDYNGLYNTFVRIDVKDHAGSTSLAQSFEGMSLPTTSLMVQNFVEGLALEP